MNTSTRDGWHRTSPFAILFFIGRIIRLVAKNAWQTIAPLFVYISIGKEDLVTKLVFGGIAITIAIVGGSILSWMFFRYQISSDSASSRRRNSTLTLIVFRASIRSRTLFTEF